MKEVTDSKLMEEMITPLEENGQYIKGKSVWKGNELDGGHVESGSNVERQ